MHTIYTTQLATMGRPKGVKNNRQHSVGGLRLNSGGVRDNSGGARVNSGGARDNSGGARVNSGGVRDNSGGARVNSGGARDNSGGGAVPTYPHTVPRTVQYNIRAMVRSLAVPPSTVLSSYIYF